MNIKLKCLEKLTYTIRLHYYQWRVVRITKSIDKSIETQTF